jgi:hypothetical protein
MKIVRLYVYADNNLIPMPVIIDNNLAYHASIVSTSTDPDGGRIMQPDIRTDDLRTAASTAIDSYINRFGIDIRQCVVYSLAHPGWRDDLPVTMLDFLNAFSAVGVTPDAHIVDITTQTPIVINDDEVGLLLNSGTSYSLCSRATTPRADYFASRDPYYIQSGVNHYNFGWNMQMIVLPEDVLSGNTIDISQLDTDRYGNYIKSFSFSTYWLTSGSYTFDTSIGLAAQGDFPVSLAAALFDNHSVVLPDPYTPDVPGGGSSEPGGGDGTWDFSDDTISVPQLPTLQAINAGFIAAYSPTLQQLNDLANFMWTSNFKTNLIKLFGEDAMAVIMGLHIIPAQPETLAASNVWLGNVNTNVQMPQIYNQFLEVDCGTIQIDEKYGAFLDYEPYTKASLFLPYIGDVQLNVNDIMGKALGVIYHIDVISGACNAYVTADGSVLYNYIGSCAASLPITQNDYTNIFRGIMQIASSIPTLAASASMPFVGGIAAGASLSSAAASMHPEVKHSGSVTGSAGLMSIQTPYLIMTVPRICAPARQNYYKGYPGLVTVPLGTLSGFTVVDSIHLDQMPGTEDEKKELLGLLTSGVIL